MKNSAFWQLRTRPLLCGERPLVMGIVNVTPDSFSDGREECCSDVSSAVDRALKLESQGADLIDIGGESTRPGAMPVSSDEELRRVMPVVERLSGVLKVPISIDTTKARVARAAVEAGAEVVNDVSGGEWDEELWAVVAQSGAGYVLMHCQGHPATMQVNPVYGDVVAEVYGYLERRLAAASAAGIAPERVVCDVGFGFGKRYEHNVALLEGLDRFAALGRPVLVGMSRKSFVKKLGGEEYLSLCTEWVHLWAAARGASIWRVHDVKTAAAAARVAGALLSTPT
jgi:dihydropteroate synthase